MASNPLQNRNKLIVERRYIDNVLREELQNIEQAQNRQFTNFGFKSEAIRSRRTFIVSNNIGEFTHLISQRFIDMKRLRGKTKKSYPIHNSIIMGHFSNIINKLHFGLTQDVRNSIANQLNIEA